MALRWRRGFFRLWIAASAFWIVLVAFIAYESVVVPAQVAAAKEACFQARKANPSLGDPWDCYPSHALEYSDFADIGPWWKQTEEYLSLGFLPPLGLLGLGFLTAWIIGGFTRATD